MSRHVVQQAVQKSCADGVMLNSCPSAPAPIQDNQIATLGKKLSLMQGNDHSQNKLIVDQKIADLTSVLEQKKKASNTLTKTLKEFEVSPGRPVNTPNALDH